MPEQPEVRTPTRRPTPLPRLAMYAWTWLAAFSVSVTGAISAFAFMESGDPLLFLDFIDFTRGCLRVLLLVVLDRGLDGVLGQDRAVDLHRRERQLLGDLRVLDGRGLVQGLALDPLGYERARRDRRAAAVGLEARILDAAVGADLDLQLHDVAAGRRADHAGADGIVALVERADVSRVFVVIYYFVAICHIDS